MIDEEQYCNGYTHFKPFMNLTVADMFILSSLLVNVNFGSDRGRVL